MSGDPIDDRVMVFIDGQNLVKALRSEFRTRVHPLLLARRLASERGLAEVTYYSGIHKPDENAKIYALAKRRHDLIRRTGVTVVERQLQYHWEWSIVNDLEPAGRAQPDERHSVAVERTRRAREKGIDLALGLDAVTSALLDKCSTIIVVSRDRDLVEIAKEIHERTRSTAVRVEVALVAGRSKYTLDGYDHTHWIDQEMVDACRDDFDYREDLPEDEVAKFLNSIDS